MSIDLLNKINSIKQISDEDREILIKSITNHTLIKNLSIFLKTDYKKLDNYEYIETDDNENIYYINLHFTYLSLFFTKNKKILYYSKWFTGNIHHFITHYDDIIKILKIINIKHTSNNISFNSDSDSDSDNDMHNDINNTSNIRNNIGNINNFNIIDIGSNIISIQKWFQTYGHFKDELFSLADFTNKLQNINTNTNINYTPFVDFPTDNLIVKFPVTNYNIIFNYIYDDNAINAYNYGKTILKMKKVFLIKHTFNDPTFHSFPNNITNKIISKITDFKFHYHNIFITRGIATHLPRNLTNQNEIENYLISIDFKSINPELIEYNTFINYVKNANNIVMTWGGSLVNMIYFKENTNVFILKSQSYADENINLFNKIINNYKLNINIIDSENNIIPLTQLKLLENL